MKKNTCLGILGESGSGKSITCKSLLNILNKNHAYQDLASYICKILNKNYV